MTERLSQFAPDQSEVAIPQPEAVVGAIEVEPAELVRRGIMFSIENGGLDRKKGYEILAGTSSNSKK
jgi:hypothetical protein